MANELKFHPYQQAAGGWGSLRASIRSMRQEGILVDGTTVLLRLNQVEGFDCPGCAWPDPDIRSTFEFCENGVKAVAAEATSRRVTPDFFANHPVAELADQTDYWLEEQGRLTEPMAYDAATDCYQPITWEDAFARIAGHLHGLQSPNEAIFYTSGRTSNEAAFLYQLMVRAFGTNNLPDCSNMCHEPTSVGMPDSIGIGKGTVTLEDFEHAQLILMFGHNPGGNSPRMLGTLSDLAKRGGRILAFNPLKERGLERFVHPQNPAEMLSGHGTQLAMHIYQPRLGGDYAIALGIARYILEQGSLDEDFIATHTAGFTAFAELVKGTPWSQIEAESGLTRQEMEEVGAMYDRSSASIITWGMGITQQPHAVDTIHMLVNLLLLKGNIGRPGAGAAPIRGHSNVQGDRTMGIWERPPARLLDRLEEVFGFSPPREDGYDVVAAIDALERGAAKVFFGLGGNFANATPDTVRTHRALQKAELTVHVTTKLNRSHIVHGKDALILPCLGRTEIDLQNGRSQGVTVEDSMSMVHISHGIRPPASPLLRSEVAIVAGLARALLPQSQVPWEELVADYDRIRDLIAQVIPGFEDFNARVHHAGGFHLDLAPRRRVWPTENGKANFLARPLGEVVSIQFRPELAEKSYRLMTTRSHDQYNTTIYGFEDRYRGVSGARNVCFIHPDDLKEAGFAEGEAVDIVSHWHDGERQAKGYLLLPYDIPRGCLAGYYPELNVLVPLDSYAERARTPTSKSILVTLRRPANG
ncbi:FdhF/YdeP family oxidoreductase [Acidithiobacillus sp. M4-SHS-6]|uniref:FdhF/YdeP family oxidoreductase n=1 Tax=Acidithiobacillus sp. M4-SHS-6 TaxID=3383024 RepID=UPI0039BE753C